MSVVLRRTVVVRSDWPGFIYMSGSLHPSQVNSSCQSNVLSPPRINWLVSFSVMLLAVRLKWRRSVVIGRSGSVGKVRSLSYVALFVCNVNILNESCLWYRWWLTPVEGRSFVESSWRSRLSIAQSRSQYCGCKSTMFRNMFADISSFLVA